MSNYILVETTTDNREMADKIASSVLEKRLAACVQISTCVSMYRWKGKVERADEFICNMKSRLDLYSDLKTAIRSVHNYEVPEIIATKVKSVDSDYLAWLDEELRTDDEESQSRG